MIKLLSIVPYKFLPAQTGGQKFIAWFHRFLAHHISITCAGTQQNIPEAAAGYELLPVMTGSFTRYFNPLLALRLQRLIRTRQFTHVMIQHPYMGWLGVCLKQLTGVKLIVQSHNIEGQRFKSIGKSWAPLLAQYERWVHRRADYNFFITPEDAAYAIERFKLAAHKCMVATYGIAATAPPRPAEKQAAQAILRATHNIAPGERIVLFNGTFDYAPNAAALNLLVQRIYPLLQQQQQPFTLIICGKDIPQHIQQLALPGLVIAGFVPDMDLYLRGAELFLNPITQGGGIKTKLVEALASDMACISFASGAIGIPAAVTGGQLAIVPDHDVAAFCNETARIMLSLQPQQHIPAAFFSYFNWEHITEKAAAFINS
ncbi:glycosyltransferase [Deminuibacter soli]|uniref:Glycosyltransferase n=1 Tax=Deminuibacter soli TaxID=2291815 RepID=A0A3E1NES9_9BACT|nr:glycosyltransferase [Deminuibacter soli]RFM26489.1 glycosyltransferase [Deminuibacter soli]